MSSYTPFLNVYLTIVGKTFNLANFTPTIFKRKQANTAGYRVKILEAFVKPGRFGGTIEMEPDDPENQAGYVPAANIPYRVLVVPQGVSFDPNHPETANSNPDIRKYPADGWDVTNAEGEFIRMDGSIVMNESGEFVQTEDSAANEAQKFFLNKDDSAYLEFQVGGESGNFLSDPIHPTLPFSNVTLTKADYFNDFVTGQVQPIRVLNWAATQKDPPEVQYMWAYYKNGLVHISPKHSLGFDSWSYGGKASGLTDDYGNFDTRWHFSKIDNGLTIPIMLNAIDVRANDSSPLEYIDVSLVDHEAVFNKTIPAKPTMDLSYGRTVTAVDNSYKRSESDGKITEEMAYDEHLWIINPGGTRTVTEEEFEYSAWSFSTVDSTYRTNDMAICNAIAALSGNNKWSMTPSTVLPHGNAILTPVLDDKGNETGTALFSQRVTVRWVWQKHPNPVKIISADNTETTAEGGSFQVAATGFAPFAYSLKGGPQGVVIDSESGIITFPAGLTKQQYTFTVRAEEDRTQQILINLMKNPYQGNDPSPPAEQTFTLTVKESTVLPEPTTQPTTEPTTETTPEPSTEPTPVPTTEPLRTAPVIDAARHAYALSMTAGSADLELPITATGSTPITWSLIQYGERPYPAEISIEPNSGLLTVSKNIAAGTYGFIIRAENDIGFDTQECRLDVIAPPTAPAITVETHNYVFSKLAGADDMTVPVTAAGSTPVSWSLVQTGRAYPIPTQVTIDARTGVLTFAKSIAAGTYYFTIRATNAVGSDTQDCTLYVIVGRRTTGLAAEPETSPKYVQLAVSSGGSSLTPSQEFPSMSTQFILPPNAMTIVNDHALDTYTNDRNTIDGTSYLRWDETMFVTVEGKTIISTIRDDAPVCEKYHYMDPIIIPESVKNAIRNDFKMALTEYQTIVVVPGGDIDTENLLEDIGNFTDTLEGGLDSYLEFGSLIDQMKVQGGGKFDVDLNKNNGTMVPGAYFLGLADNKGASLTFHQDGMDVSFTGERVVTSDNTEFDLYNFAYQEGALHEDEMLAAAGSGGQNHSFSFAYHGQLPGTAAFNVTTDIAEGTRVNVYNYDEMTGVFTTIAQGLTVGGGGVVTYKNDRMSEYLITTQTIAGAEFSDMAEQQGPTGGKICLFIGIGLIAVFAGAAFWIVLLRRKRARKTQ